jgi:hypothetical protein
MGLGRSDKANPAGRHKTRRIRRLDAPGMMVWSYSLAIHYLRKRIRTAPISRDIFAAKKTKLKDHPVKFW